MLPYRFVSDLHLDGLLNRLESSRWTGQIVGPHGSGKSTLLHSLYDSLQRAGCEAILAQADSVRAQIARGTILLLDSAERIPVRRIRALARAARMAGGGIVVTSHRDIGLPILHRTTVTLELALGIVGTLLADSSLQPSPERVTAALRAREGNLRLALFDLYDWYEESARNLPQHPEEVNNVKHAADHQRVG